MPSLDLHPRDGRVTARRPRSVEFRHRFLLVTEASCPRRDPRAGVSGHLMRGAADRPAMAPALQLRPLTLHQVRSHGEHRP